jgi:hypothetical protein
MILGGWWEDPTEHFSRNTLFHKKKQKTKTKEIRMTTVKYGVSSSINRDFDDMTVGELINENNILSSLNAPEGVVAVHAGRTLDNDALVANYENITLEKRASSKA